MKRDKFLNFRKFVLRKNNILALFCLLAYFPCQAELIVRSAATPFAQYAAWITTHPDDRSWVSQIEKFHPSKTEVANLSELVENSQKAFLSGSLDEAKKKFKQISDLANSNDWHASEREAITYSMLRFAQLEKSTIGLNYIKKAANFGYDCHFNSNLFPPPLTKIWNHELTVARKKAIKISNLKDFSGFDIIKIDGRTYSLHDTESITIFPGEHRISFLGSNAQYFTQRISSSQLQVMKIEPVILVSGTCDAPMVSAESHFPFTALFEDTCIRHFNGQVWTNQKSKLDKLDVQTANFKRSEQNFDPTVVSEVSPKPESSHRLLWISIGVAALTSLALVYQNNHNQISNLGGGSGAGSTTSAAPAPAVTPVHKQGN